MAWGFWENRVRERFSFRRCVGVYLPSHRIEKFPSQIIYLMNNKFTFLF